MTKPESDGASAWRDSVAANDHCSSASNHCPTSFYFIFTFQAAFCDTQTKSTHQKRHTLERIVRNHRCRSCRIYLFISIQRVSLLPPSLLECEGPALLNYSSHRGEDRSMHAFSTPCLFFLSFLAASNAKEQPGGENDIRASITARPSCRPHFLQLPQRSWGLGCGRWPPCSRCAPRPHWEEVCQCPSFKNSRATQKGNRQGLSGNLLMVSVRLKLIVFVCC